jgi:hypothetical protein
VELETKRFCDDLAGKLRQETQVVEGISAFHCGSTTTAPRRPAANQRARTRLLFGTGVLTGDVKNRQSPSR